MYKLKKYNGISYEIYGKEYREEKWCEAIKESLLTLAFLAALFALAYVACAAVFIAACLYHGYRIF